MTKLFSIIEIEMKPHCRDAYLAAARELIERHRNDAGLVSHEIHVDAATPCRCIITIGWRDETALRAHYDSPLVKAHIRETSTYLAQPAIHRTFTIDNNQTLL